MVAHIRTWIPCLFLVLATEGFSQEVWVKRNKYPFSQNYTAVTWTGNQLVVVTEDGSVRTSPDGIVWTDQVTRQDKRLLAVTWTGALVVAVGDDGTILTSPDAITWTSRHAKSREYLQDVTWTGGRAVAWGYDFFTQGGVMLTSLDGIEWTYIADPTPRFHIIVRMDTQVVAMTGLGRKWTSPDWETWTYDEKQTIPFVGLSIWTGSQMFSVGDGSFYTSADLVTWESHPSEATKGPLQSMAWSGKHAVAVGAKGAIVSSMDGVSWTVQQSGVEYDLRSVAWTGAQFVAVGNNGTVLTSVPGASGISAKSPAFRQGRRAARTRHIAFAKSRQAAGVDPRYFLTNGASVKAGF